MKTAQSGSCSGVLNEIKNDLELHGREPQRRSCFTGIDEIKYIFEGAEIDLKFETYKCKNFL